MPTDPRALVAAAAPFYDYTSADLKPWHLRATYQLYDEKGAPTEQGTFEYWWLSPQVHRSSWKRGGSSEDSWHLAGDQQAFRREGEPLKYFEYKIEDALLSPLPHDSDLDPAKNTVQRETVSLGDFKVSCIMTGPILGAHPGLIARVPIGLFPTYCFDLHLPVLRISYSLGSVITEYNSLAKTQNRYLARELKFLKGKQQVLSASVDLISGLSPADPH